MTDSLQVLILGGNGYLGSKVVRSLIELDYVVVCTKRENSDVSRLHDLGNRIRWISSDMECIENFCKTTKCDVVINMACNYGKDKSFHIDVLEANLIFPLKVLDIVVKKGVKNFITIGTGLPDDFNMYSLTKKKFSEFGRFYSEAHKVNFCDLKLEMFYGADEPENRFIPHVIREMLRGNEVDTTLGTQHRDVIAVEDVVKAILIVLQRQPKGYCEISIGTGVAPSVSELVKFLWKETGEKSVLNIGAISMRKNEPDSVADTSYINNLAKWNPIRWQDGMRVMINSIRNSMEEVCNENFD